MRRIFPLLFVILAGAGLSGCAARLAPDWTIDERSAINSDANLTGLRFPDDADATTWVNAPLHPILRYACGTSTVRNSFSRGALWPGFGARIHVDYWTTSTTTFISPLSNSMPTRVTFDGILRKVEPSTGRLSAQEKVLLATFLAVNRAYAGDVHPSQDERSAAASVVDRNETTLWNAFAANFCVEFIQSPTEPDPSGRSVLSFKSDITALCRSLKADGARAFSQVFVHARSNNDQTKDCVLPQPEENENNQAPPARQKGAAAEQTASMQQPQVRPLIPPQSTLLGTLDGSARNTLGQTAAETAASLGNTAFYDSVGLKIAAIGEITLGHPQFGSEGSERWSLADWEGSGLCIGAGNEKLAIDRVTLRSGARFAIAAQGNYGVVRRLDEKGYQARFARLDPHKKRRTLVQADLSYLTPADVQSVRWRTQDGRRMKATCTRQF